MNGTYFRWTRIHTSAPTGELLTADILGTEITIIVYPENGTVCIQVSDLTMSPDEARLIGVRLIEAAVLADNGRSVREP